MSTPDHETYAALVNPTTNLWGALLRVQGKATKVRRDNTNPHFRSRYATLEAVWDTLRGPLHDAGLVVIQKAAGVTDGMVEVTTTVVHAKSGEADASTIVVPCPKADPQGVGSATTYACRYALMAYFGLPPSDDDGEAARVDNARQVDAPPRLSPDGEVVPTLEEALATHADSITAIKEALASGDDAYALQCWDELSNAAKQALWVAPSKFTNAPFTTAERTTLKRLKAESSKVD